MTGIEIIMIGGEIALGITTVSFAYWGMNWKEKAQHACKQRDIYQTSLSKIQKAYHDEISKNIRLRDILSTFEKIPEPAKRTCVSMNPSSVFETLDAAVKAERKPCHLYRIYYDELEPVGWNIECEFLTDATSEAVARQNWELARNKTKRFKILAVEQVREIF